MLPPAAPTAPERCRAGAGGPARTGGRHPRRAPGLPAPPADPPRSRTARPRRAHRRPRRAPGRPAAATPRRPGPPGAARRRARAPPRGRARRTDRRARRGRCAASSGSPSSLASSSPVAARDVERASWVRPASRSAACGSVMRESSSCTDPMRASVASRSAPCSRSWRASSRSWRSSSSRRGSGLSTFSSPTSSATSSTRSATRSAASRAARRWATTSSWGFGHATRSRVIASPMPTTASGRRASRGRKARRRSTAFRRARASSSWRTSSGSSASWPASSRAVPSRWRSASSSSARRAASTSDGRERTTWTAHASAPTPTTPSWTHGGELEREGAGQQLDERDARGRSRRAPGCPARTARRHQSRRRRLRSRPRASAPRRRATASLTVRSLIARPRQILDRRLPGIVVHSDRDRSGATARRRRRNAQRMPAGTTSRVERKVRSAARATNVIATRGHQ